MAIKKYKVVEQSIPSGGSSVDLQPLWTKINEMNDTLQTCFNEYSESNSSINGAGLTRVNGEKEEFWFIDQIKQALPH